MGCGAQVWPFANAFRPAAVIRTRATLIDLPQLFPEDCGFLF
jgi:hypothetical protein